MVIFLTGCDMGWMVVSWKKTVTKRMVPMMIVSSWNMGPLTLGADGFSIVADEM